MREFGHTLIEMLVVISLISILAALLLPSVVRSYVSSRNRMMWLELYHNDRLDLIWIEFYQTNTPDSAFKFMYKGIDYGDVPDRVVKAWRKGLLEHAKRDPWWFEPR